MATIAERKFYRNRWESDFSVGIGMIFLSEFGLHARRCLIAGAHVFQKEKLPQAAILPSFPPVFILLNLRYHNRRDSTRPRGSR